jgi:hypothetical protein
MTLHINLQLLHKTIKIFNPSPNHNPKKKKNKRKRRMKKKKKKIQRKGRKKHRIMFCK